MNTGPRIHSYEWRGGREPMLRVGPEDGPAVVLALPLLEEANRTRAFGVSILRALAVRGIGGVLPELPGQGESVVATEQATLTDLRDAFSAAPGSHSLAIRSGALLVDQARPCWLLAPQTRAELSRELARVKGGPLNGERIEIAGNLVSRELIEALGIERLPGEGRGRGSGCLDGKDAIQAASQLGPGLRRGSIGSVRTVRLASDPHAADLHVEGPALWRRAEPSHDCLLAERIAVDIADWIRTCGG